MPVNSLCDYLDSRIDAINAAIKRGECTDSMREELHEIASLLHEIFEQMK